MSLDPPSSPREDGDSSPRQFASTVFLMLQTRFELAAIELAEEKDRLIRVFLLSLAVAMLIALALIALTALMVVVCWDTCRWQVLTGITVVYAVAAFLCVVWIRHRLRNAPPLFQATMRELEKDSKLFRKP